MNNSEKRRTNREIEQVIERQLSPRAARCVNHLFFTHVGDDNEIITMTRFMDACDTYMEGVDSQDFYVDQPVSGEVIKSI